MAFLRAHRYIILAALPLLAGQAGLAGELTPLEAQGRQIYREGTSPSGATIQALVGVDGFELPASSMPCASCHGRDGRGRPEGGVVPSDITWSHLTTSYGHEHAYGREHPAFDEAAVTRTIRERIDPAGNRLDIAMPAYRMPDAELAALIAYLKRIETDYDPGVAPNALRVATLLPTSGRMAPIGGAMLAVLEAYTAELNAGGGINGRRVHLEVLPWDESAATALEGLEKRVTGGDVFALVSPFSVGIESELARFAEDHELPVIAPYTLQPPPVSALDRYTFRLFPGAEDLVRVLVEAAADSADADPGVLVVGPGDEVTTRLVEAIDRQLRQRDWRAAHRQVLATGAFDARALAQRVRETGAGVLFFFGAATELNGLLATLADEGLAPLVALPPDRVTPALFDAPAVFEDRIISAFPRLPADVTPAGQKAYASLRAGHELSNDYASAQLAVLAAAKTFSEGVMRAGKQLNRDSLIEALEGLNEFETGLAPPLTFGLNRRIGALGAHVVRADLEHRTFVPEGPWRSLQ